ncbi:MAG: PqqD family protein [Clostridia bacterium]|nr:PqqD family protein [Clostridia bacterium]
MKKKKTVISENYLERKPVRCDLKWSADENGIVTLEKENTGVMNRIAQKLFHKPEISYIHLDETGSFLWPMLDGETSIIVLGERVKEHFGEKAEPLYQRLIKYLQILESYGFVRVPENTKE